MRTLTLDQVKRAGRFAFQLTGGEEVPIYNPHTGEIQDIVPWGERVTTTDVELASEYHDFTTGWHHLQGCDCEFCDIEALRNAVRKSTAPVRMAENGIVTAESKHFR